MQRRLTAVWSWPPRIQRRAWRQLVNSTQIAVDDVCRRIAFRLIGGEEMSRLIGQNGRDMLAVHEETRKKRSGMGGPRETTVAHVSVPRWRNLMEQWGWWRRRRAPVATRGPCSQWICWPFPMPATHHASLSLTDSLRVQSILLASDSFPSLLLRFAFASMDILCTFFLFFSSFLCLPRWERDSRRVYLDISNNMV